MTRDRGPNPIDVHVGRRVRLRRHAVGVTQEALASQLGLTFQQVQKYERGANRISASKLFEIGRILAVPVAHFFEGLDPAAPLDGGRDDLAERLLVEPGGRALAESFLAIRSRPLKRCLVDLAGALAAESEADDHQNPDSDTCDAQEIADARTTRISRPKRR